MNSIRIDWAIVFFAITSTLIGIITLYGGGGYGESLAKKQFVWMILGIGVMFAMAFVNYQTLGSYAAIIYGSGILLLLITLLVGTEVKGAKAWLRIANFGFQPAEFMKVGLIIALAKYLSMREKTIANINELFLPFLIGLVPMILIGIQPDLGYAMLIIPVVIVMLHLGGANNLILTGLVIVGFFSLFVPMYLEYHKYIIIDDIVRALAAENSKLSNAVKILGFDSWRYIENPGDYAGIKPETLGWAKTMLLNPENAELFRNTAGFIFDQNSNFLRNFLSSDKAVIVVILVFALIYGITTFLYFYIYRIGILKNSGIVALIISLAFASSYTLRKSVSFKPHQVVRIVSFANPDKFPKGAGYQLRHSIITIGSGQVTGKGFGEGDMTKGEVSFLPEWYNDFIFSVVGEQFGMLGNLLVLVLLFGLVLRGISITWKSKDQFGMLLSGGISITMLLHVVINTGITLGLLPVTGIPLIFLSYGGSNLVFSFAALGILLNIHMRRFTNI